MRRFLLAGAGLIALSGCTMEPHYQRPVAAVPQSWPVGAAYAPAQTAPTAAIGYRDLFKDPRLLGVIDRALAGNQDLRAAVANVQVARAQYRIQRADLFPQIGASGSGTETRTRVTTGGVSQRQTSRSYDADIGLASFEIDLFGRLRSLSHAAQEQYLASEAGARSVRLALIGETANAWLTLAADRSLLTIATDTQASAQRTVDLTQAKLQGGVAPRSDLAQATTLLQQAKSDVADLTTAVAQDRNALELLVGGQVSDAELPASIESLDGVLAEAPAGLDSHVLLQRPDVTEAEHQLKAANAEIGAARAAFFPTISLTGLAGYASPQLSSLFHGRNYSWQGQGGVSLPIFAGGANVAGLARSKAQRDVAVANYQGAIQSAFRDVADALARRGTIRDQIAAQAELERAATESYDLAQARYREGIDPYLATLDTQRTLYSARRTHAAARLVQAANLVTLYVSLGGERDGA
jgi:multidrug efflux system outer membrane protein